MRLALSLRSLVLVKLLESASVDDAGIDKAQKELDKALMFYSNTIKRLEVQGGKVEPSADSVKEYVRSHSYFSYLTDRSGVADIRDEDDDASDMDFSNGPSSSDAVVALEMNGKALCNQGKPMKNRLMILIMTN